MSRATRMSGASSLAAIPPTAAAQAKAGRRFAATALYALMVGAVLFGSSTPALADCMRDRMGRVVCDRGPCARDSHGQVYCSAYEDGTAIRNRFGDVVCGKGACVTTLEGKIICAARPGGAAMRDSRGRVTCEGGCELASPALCGQGGDAWR